MQSELAESSDAHDTTQPEPTLLAIPQGSSSTRHLMSIVLHHLLHVPFLSEELVLALVDANLEHRAWRMAVERILELGKQLGDVREAGGVDVVIFVHGEVVGRVAGVDDVDEGEGVVGLQFEDADVWVGRRGDVEPVWVLGALRDKMKRSNRVSKPGRRSGE